MSLILDGSASVTINSGAVLGITSGTAVASTSGTSIDFTSIPSWVKRITVMFNGVSTNGTSIVQVQIGSGSVTTTGYVTGLGTQGATSNTSCVIYTTGFPIVGVLAADNRYAAVVLYNITGNTWLASGCCFASSSLYSGETNGSIALGGTLDRIRITTVNGTDTFDAGSINILYE
jgi:hypothetical protein